MSEAHWHDDAVNAPAEAPLNVSDGSDGSGGAGDILKTLNVASELVEAIHFDGDMHYPMAGNGGLLSEKTIRKADELHKLLIKIGVREQ